MTADLAPPIRAVRRALLLALSVQGPGGIQRYLRDLSGALAEAISDGGRLDAIALHDGDDEARAALEGPRVRARGLAGRGPRGRLGGRLRLCAAAARAALGGRTRPDLVVCGHLKLAPVAVALGRAARAPVWLPLYGIEAWDRPPLAQRLAARATSLLLPIGRLTSERALAWLGPRPPAVEVLPCAIDGDRFPLAAPRPAGVEPTLLTVARLSRGDEDKGVESVLRALPRVLEAVPGARYDVVGDGDDRPRLEEVARSLGVAHRVRFRGRLSEADLPLAYAACDAFVMPSRKEGFGIVFLEALASGRPVIAGAGDGARDPLDDGRLGLLVDPASREALEGAIVRLLRREVDPRLLDGALLRAVTLRRFGRDAFRQRVARLVRR